VSTDAVGIAPSRMRKAPSMFELYIPDEDDSLYTCDEIEGTVIATSREDKLLALWGVAAVTVLIVVALLVGPK